jgi:hypothetical protein
MRRLGGEAEGSCALQPLGSNRLAEYLRSRPAVTKTLSPQRFSSNNYTRIAADSLSNKEARTHWLDQLCLENHRSREFVLPVGFVRTRCEASSTSATWTWPCFRAMCSAVRVLTSTAFVSEPRRTNSCASSAHPVRAVQCSAVLSYSPREFMQCPATTKTPTALGRHVAADTINGIDIGWLSLWLIHLTVLVSRLKAYIISLARSSRKRNTDTPHAACGTLWLTSHGSFPAALS